MKLYEDAAKITVFGLEMYRFGFFVMLGMIAAVAVFAFLSWAKRAEKGTAPLQILLSLLLGAVCSRVLFCLLNRELGALMPLSSWIRVAGGGWSMMGLIAGVLFASVLTAKLTGQKSGMTLDMAACALPVFMALERFGEGCVPEFDYSRKLTTGFLNGTFLTFSDYDGYYLCTWKLAAILMLILFPVMMADLIRSRKDGDTGILFLLLFGSVSVILESLRYDRFLSVSFVGLQQILAAVYMAAGVIMAARRAGRRQNGLKKAAVISVLAVAAIAIGLEFALDRTTISPILIYAVYVLVMAVPVALGLKLRGAERKPV